MSKTGKQRKAEQLGMNPSTANNRLRKMIIFEFAKRLDLDFCFQCGDKIHKIEEFSIEHKEKWLDSEDPVGLFFDLDNIAFSHLSCNSLSSRGNFGLRETTKGVYYYPNRRGSKKYKACRRDRGELYHIGWYESEEKAIGAVKEWGENRNLIYKKI